MSEIDKRKAYLSKVGISSKCTRFLLNPKLILANNNALVSKIAQDNAEEAKATENNADTKSMAGRFTTTIETGPTSKKSPPSSPPNKLGITHSVSLHNMIDKGLMSETQET